MAQFSQRHYEAIAKVLNECQAKSRILWDNADPVDEVSWELCNMFQQDNERFDREKFLKAAGVK